ncbi:hypothetical protein BDW41_10940 [Dyella sp. AtDHG13]|uniref:DUF2894 domain-containing protein n=1 Tax=Dyella sp. AtDHG13 TaxID=1938897 RepID=UPI000944CAAA|nr:DUF2894 domain-containing protein [Dyella sp. AtDHG13]PXV56048.1 hypothetical protein BDW41_10940 [Dyella sp. AtDHG13]
MTEAVSSARATLDAWRESRADRLDPVRFHFMDALEKRAAQLDGEARRLLDLRLDALLDAYAADVKRFTAENDKDRADAETVRGPFAELIDQLARMAASRSDKPDAQAAQPEMELLGEFRRIWSAVRTESQLRQSMEDAPENAGPLNSRALVHRAIGLMRELSPGYLQHFLAYVDDLSWIEQLNGSAPFAAKDTPSAANPGKRTRKPRARRE